MGQICAVLENGAPPSKNVKIAQTIQKLCHFEGFGQSLEGGEIDFSSHDWGISDTVPLHFETWLGQSSSSLLLPPGMQRIFDATVGERIPGAFRSIQKNHRRQNLFFRLFVIVHDLF